jgi:RNA polymerase sigma-70 factor (ECF subfamily)
MDEHQLVAGLKSRDPVAVRELLGLYGNRLLRSACLLSGNETEAEDLVQETILEAFRSIHRFGGRSSVYTWLHAILLNRSRRYHRKRARLLYNDEIARQDRPSDDVATHGPDHGQVSSALKTALERLSLSHREVVILRFYEDLKIDAIAEHLGISRGTVKSRLHYAIAEIQKILPAELNVFSGRGTNKWEQLR